MLTKKNKLQKTMIQPIALVFRFLQARSRVQIALYENKNLRYEGVIAGFDEYMNLVLDETEEISLKDKQRTSLGRLLLKGDNIAYFFNIEKQRS